MYHLLLTVDYISKGLMHRDLKPEKTLFQKPQDYQKLKRGNFELPVIQNDIPYLYLNGELQKMLLQKLKKIKNEVEIVKSLFVELYSININWGDFSTKEHKITETQRNVKQIQKILNKMFYLLNQKILGLKLLKTNPQH
ncbi:unnamed protein product [Paramecium sonneborni]|uniref:Uncharacterized protein n=1 Tax=Paramecium sonneborni TaxID=65129 RepID=A0A8S1N122_9CILI|nr:unnamed protein product [Paramecium sonneborni]